MTKEVARRCIKTALSGEVGGVNNLRRTIRVPKPVKRLFLVSRLCTAIFFLRGELMELWHNSAAVYTLANSLFDASVIETGNSEACSLASSPQTFVWWVCDTFMKYPPADESLQAKLTNGNELGQWGGPDKRKDDVKHLLTSCSRWHLVEGLNRETLMVEAGGGNCAWLKPLLQLQRNSSSRHWTLSLFFYFLLSPFVFIFLSLFVSPDVLVCMHECQRMGGDESAKQWDARFNGFELKEIL